MGAWASQDLVIPLDVEIDDIPLGPTSRRACEQLVRDALRRAGEEGWQFDGPVDLGTLWALGAVKLGERLGFFGLVGHYVIESVLVRVKRPVAAPTPRLLAAV